MRTIFSDSLVHKKPCKFSYWAVTNFLQPNSTQGRMFSEVFQNFKSFLTHFQPQKADVGLCILLKLINLVSVYIV